MQQGSEMRNFRERCFYDIGYWEGYEAALRNVVGHANEASVPIGRRVKRLTKKLEVER